MSDCVRRCQTVSYESNCVRLSLRPHSQQVTYRTRMSEVQDISGSVCGGGGGEGGSPECAYHAVIIMT